MATNTTNYSFQKPTVSGDSGVWGGYLNSNWDKTDSLLSGGQAITGIDINSGAIDGTAIGANSASTGVFTSVAVDNITVDGQQITSTNTNGNIQLFANGTGYIELYGNTNAGAIRFNCESNSHGITIKGAPHSAGATYSLELPNALGSSGQVLSLSDGSGKLAFTTIAATTLSDLGITSSAAELNLNDGSSAGTIVNSKTVVYGSSGEVNATTLQIAGVSITSTAAELNYNDISSLGTSEASKTVTADANGDVTLSEELIAKSYNETFVTLSGTTPTVDCETGNVFYLSTSGNTTFTFSNPPSSGTAYGMLIKLTAGGTHTISWPGTVDWAGGSAPDAPASGETDILGFITHDGGTIWYGFLAGDALA